MKNKRTWQDQVLKLDKKIADLTRKRDEIELKNRPEVKRKNRAEARRKKELLETARKKFTGKWIFIDDGMFRHISEILKITDESIENLVPGQINFEIKCDEVVTTGDGIVEIDQKSVGIYYSTLFSETEYIFSTSAVLKELDDGLVSVVKRYKEIYRAHRRTPMKITIPEISVRGKAKN